MIALWRVADPVGRERLAVGPLAGPRSYLDADLSLAGLLSESGPDLGDLLHLPTGERVREHTVLAPVDRQCVWAAGVTFLISKQARLEESGNAPFYNDVYAAPRPELFLKAIPEKVRGTGQEISIRSDSGWDVPEPELGIVLDARGTIVGCTLGNDLSSRAIEAENPLYLPQAKIWDGACAVGPAIVPLGLLPGLRELVVSLDVVRDGESIYTEAVPMSRMKRDFDELATWLFRDQTFPHGVILLTGTSMVPPDDFTLHPGDDVRISCDGLGVLDNRVAGSRVR